MGKINAIDWSYNSENELLTAGQDATVKVRTRPGRGAESFPLSSLKKHFTEPVCAHAPQCWDTANPRKEKATIQAGLPVALASYTVRSASRKLLLPRFFVLRSSFFQSSFFFIPS